MGGRPVAKTISDLKVGDPCVILIGDYAPKLATVWRRTAKQIVAKETRGGFVRRFWLRDGIEVGHIIGATMTRIGIATNDQRRRAEEHEEKRRREVESARRRSAEIAAEKEGFLIAWTDAIREADPTKAVEVLRRAIARHELADYDARIEDDPELEAGDYE